VDDEKPLWVTRDDKTGRAARIGGDSGDCVTAGVYGLPAGFTLPPSGAHARLRDFLMSVAESGRPVVTVMLAGVIDVDRPADIAAAERRYASSLGADRGSGP
jgi:hypothetical protein